MLTRDEILKKIDIESKVVAVPEWGGKVKVRGMTGEERDSFEGSITTVVDGKASVDTKNVRAKLIALCVIDEKGERLFTEKDALLLGKKSAAALQRIFDVASDLSGLSKGSVEDAIKNLNPIPSEDSTSD